MNLDAIKAYMARLPYAELFLELPADLQEKVAFGAYEMLRRRYGADAVTDELTALQALYVAEGEKEEFAKFKRHGVKTMRLEELSFTFDGSGISPEVVAAIEAAEREAEGRAYFGGFY